MCVCARARALAFVCVCARACDQEERGLGMWEGAARGVAFARGNGGGLLCVGLGG